MVNGTGDGLAGIGDDARTPDAAALTRVAAGAPVDRSPVLAAPYVPGGRNGVFRPEHPGERDRSNPWCSDAALFGRNQESSPAPPPASFRARRPRRFGVDGSVIAEFRAHTSSRVRNDMEEWMETRLDYGRVAPGAIRAMVALERYVKEETDLEPELVELVKLRASQINGCAYCIDMHTKDARAAGTEEQRLYLLSAWREAPFYSERERAALAWAEAVTLVSESRVGDEVYAFAREHFSEKELVDLTIVLTAINGWNRLSISFRPEVGSYRSPAAAGASDAGGEG